MKKVITAIVFISLVFAFTFNVCSFDIRFDGKDNGIEWEKADVITLISGESHSNISFACLKYYVDSGKRDIWLCVMLVDDKPNVFENKASITIFAENEKFTVTPTEAHGLVQTDNFMFEHYTSIDNFGGVTAEIRLGIKNGLSSEYPMKLQFSDFCGTPSDTFNVVIKSEAETSTVTEKQTTEKTTAVKTTTEPPETTRPPKTTKERITVKRRTTVPSTVPVTAVPAKAGAAKTVKAAETTAVKSKLKTERSTVSSTKPAKTKSTESVTRLSGETAGFIAEPDTTAAAVPEKLSDGSKYKIISVSAGLAALVIIAALGSAKMYGTNNKEDNSENKQ